jgi:dolichyl-phosphate-mannose--protein O-mannosyl transferase
MSTAADVTASKQRTLWYFAVVPALMFVLAIELIVPASR